jgi:predicted SAM-dependent methyltransferase
MDTTIRPNKSPAQPLKLHLGCYQKKLHGFVNVDIREDVNPDVVDDVFKLEKFAPNSAQLIYACHVLEHARPEEAQKALQRWYDVLKPNGIVRIAVPDLEAVFEYYQITKNIKELRSFLYGSQKHAYDNHYTGWDFDALARDLESVGFRNIRRYDWRETEHFYIDDYSMCYMPNISYKSRRPNDIIKGRLMSLNVEAIKD